MLELQQFCGGTLGRGYLARPFTIGEFTYATNGHIIVRVPRREGVAPPTQAIDAEKLFADIDQAAFAPPPAFNLPPVPTEQQDCQECEGSGHLHECPDCQCACERCNGSGLEDPEKHVSTQIGAAIYAMRYVRKMLALPDIEIAQGDPAAPLMFRFRDGAGLLMPRRVEDTTHVKIFEAAEPVT